MSPQCVFTGTNAGVDICLIWGFFGKVRPSTSEWWQGRGPIPSSGVLRTAQFMEWADSYSSHQLVPTCRSRFGLQLQPVRDGCSNLACKGQPAVIALMGKGAFSCRHPFMPASPYARTHGRGEPATWLYASRGRYHLPLHCLLVLYGWTGAAVLQWGVPGVPGHRKEVGHQSLNMGEKKCLLSMPQSVVNPLLGMNAFLDSH